MSIDKAQPTKAAKMLLPNSATPRLELKNRRILFSLPPHLDPN
jgi:hypothetical protein